MTDLSQSSTEVSRVTGPRRSADGRLRLLAAAEQLFATRGLGVPNREIVAAAGQHNSSAVTYHFASRAGLIDAVRERHEAPIAQHRQHLIARLRRPGDRTTRQLVEAYIQPLTAEMLRWAPSTGPGSTRCCWETTRPCPTLPYPSCSSSWWRT